MRTILLTTITCFALLSTSLNAQETKSITPVKPEQTINTIDKYPTIDFYGTIPLKQCGWGMGFGVYAPAYKIGMINPYLPIHLRFGGEFYIQEMHKRFLGKVPLSAPQIGDASVRLSQNNLGFNFVGRLSTPYSKKFTPYLDGYIGVRNFWTGMSITPTQKQEGYEDQTSKNLSNYWQFTYGASVGFMYSLGKYVKFNTGLMYGTSNKIGEIVDIAKARVDNGNIVTQTISTPKEMLTLKVGFTFIIDDTESKSKRDCHCNCRTTRTSTWRSSSTRSGGTKSNHVNINIRPSK